MHLESFTEVALNTLYDDTVVNKVFIAPVVLHDIENFSRSSTQTTKEIPEVGGFLLGRFKEDQGKDLAITLEHFFPVTDLQMQSASILVMGNGIATAYSKVIDQFPHLAIVGWFHTHPGHSVFLSLTDLRTQDIHFTLKYQVALVLDPLTEAFNFGIFSRKKSGAMNNSIDQKKQLHWKLLIEQHDKFS